MIQWFPGHMAKAKKEIEENLKLVDVVVEIVDARTPKWSQNPLLQEVIKNKQKVIVLMKRDLADENRNEEWLDTLNNEHTKNVDVVANSKDDIKKVRKLIETKG